MGYMYTHYTRDGHSLQIDLTRIAAIDDTSPAVELVHLTSGQTLTFPKNGYRNGPITIAMSWWRYAGSPRN
jgi:hypothetical protein